MVKEFKVWIEIEEVSNPDTQYESHKAINMPFGGTATFPTLEEAMLFCKQMHRSIDRRGKGFY